MEYRKLGRTGQDVSIIGLGCEHLEGQEPAQVADVVAAAVDHGANYLDIFMAQSAVRSNIGAALRGKLDKVLLCGHIGATLNDEGQYLRSRDVEHCVKYVDDFRTRTGKDVVDVLMLHYIDEMSDLDRVIAPGGILEKTQELQRQGSCRYIGMSSHNADVARKLVEMDVLDVLMFSVNPAHDMLRGDLLIDDYFSGQGFDILKTGETAVAPERRALYLACERHGTGIVTMKTYGGGLLLKPDFRDNTGIPPMTTTQLAHYALSQPGVSCILPGCRTVEEVEMSMAYLTATAEERDFGPLLSGSRWNLTGQCLYCNHCLPCPQGIDIAKVTKMLHAAQQDQSEGIGQAYGMLDKKGSDCIACGQCNGRCPFAVDAKENMAQAAQLLG